MSWNCITVAGADGATPTPDAAVELIEAMEYSYKHAGKPAGVEVFHRRRGDGTHVFYLSPTASALFAVMALTTAAVECDEPSHDERKIRVRL